MLLWTLSQISVGTDTGRAQPASREGWARDPSHPIFTLFLFINLPGFLSFLSVFSTGCHYLPQFLLFCFVMP